MNSPCPRKLGNWRAAWRSNESSELKGKFIVHECIVCGIVLYKIRSSDSSVVPCLHNCTTAMYFEPHSKGCTKFPKMWEASQNTRCQKVT